MKMFLDDSREFPKTGYECVRDTESAKMLLRIMQFEFITLDYDLGIGEENGFDILVWMKENDVFVPHINIHSNHILGKKKMYDFCKENFPNSKTTMNTLPK